MPSLESIVEELSPDLQGKIREVENSGKSFLFGLAQFSSSDLVSLTTSKPLIEYCSQVILTTTEDSRVFPFSLYLITRNFRQSLPLYFSVYPVRRTMWSALRFPFHRISSIPIFDPMQIQKHFSVSNFLWSSRIGLEVCLQKLVFIVSRVRYKKHIEPTLNFSSVGVNLSMENHQ